ncbi:MAG: hypothetical protein GF364_07570 [Candidatus Lokiarchaeota archaeon]|nr:hypothetical protein [Candidatus Lokiarchaeota archaeon]
MKRNNDHIDIFARTGFLIVLVYVFITQFSTDLILQLNGILFAWTAFYWFIHIAGLVTGLLVFFRWKHPLMNIFGPIYLFGLGYFMTRYLIKEFWYTMPIVFVFHVLFIGILVLNLFIFIAHLVQNMEKNAIKNLDLRKCPRKWIYLSILLTLIWSSLTMCSYFGFGKKISIEDAGSNNDIKISFWGYPFGSDNASYYVSGQADEELEFYSQWDTAFYLNLRNLSLANGSYMHEFAQMVKVWESFDIDFIINICPVNMEAKKVPRGDFVSYYYLEEVNDSIDLAVTWAKNYSLSNFRGISLDVEGPKYTYDNYGNKQIVSYEQWQKGVISYQNKLDWFKTECPGNKTFLIAMDGIIFDFYDDDPDLDIMQRTCSVPPVWDYYGYMTYMIGNPSGLYPYYYYMQEGSDRHGDAFLPWIGWINEYEQLSEEPYYYDAILDNFKIVKSMNMDEVVIAPSRYLLGNFSNYDERDQIMETMFERLNDINQTRNSTFESFDFQIHHDKRIYDDSGLYWKKWTPYTFMSSSNVFKDLMLETNGEWLMYVQCGAAILIIGLLSIYIKIVKPPTIDG